MPPPGLARAIRGAVLITAFLISPGYPLIGLFLLVLTVIAEVAFRRLIPWQHGPLDVFLAGFIVVFMISGWLSAYRPIAVGSAGLAALTIYLAFGPLYAQLRQDKAFLTPLVRWWVSGALVAAVWGITMHLRTGNPARTVQLPQNALATAILIGLVLDIGLFLISDNYWRYITAGGFLLALLALTFTTSRAALLAAVISLMTFFPLIGFRYAWRGVLLTLLSGVVVIMFIATESGAGTAGFRVEKEATTFDRILMARSAEAIFLDHPVFGTGMNTFSLAHQQYRLPGDPNAEPPFAHNIFLNMAAEGGVLGFAAFTAIVVSAGVAGWRWRATSRSRPDIVLSAAIFSAFLGTLVQQMFDGTIISVHLGIAFWFLVAILAAFRPEPETAPVKESEPSQPVRQ